MRLSGFLLAVIFILSLNSLPVLCQTGIKGKIEMDSAVWAPLAYLSIIPDFTQMHTMSYELIIDRADISESGEFSFSADFLSEEDQLYRIHFSKRDDPPASLIIGGRDENHFFLVANNLSSIEVKSISGIDLLNNISFSGYSPNNSLREINEITSYLNTLDYYGSTSNREFVRQAVNDKLRNYADTCAHPLISLYSLYQTRFESDYKMNPDFYKKYLRKWRKEDSEYFAVFRSQLPIEGSENNIFGLLLVLGIIIFPIWLYFYRQSKKTGINPFQSLTVQERRVFGLLKQGLSNKDISDECGISVSTVKSHVNNIYSKLDINSRKEVMDFVE